MRKNMCVVGISNYRQSAFNWTLKVKIICECGNVFEEDYKITTPLEVICDKCYSLASNRGMHGQIPSVSNLVRYAVPPIKFPRMNGFNVTDKYMGPDVKAGKQTRKKPQSDKAFKNCYMLRPGRFGKFPNHWE